MQIVVREFIGKTIIGSVLMKYLSFINPESILKDPQNIIERRMKQFLHEIVSLNQVSASQFDTAFQEFSQFVNDTNY